ncbi:MAG: peptide deformylase [Candidatus Daviesbacteria bacterium]
MEVVRAPDAKLRIKTKPVKKITPELLKIASEMIEITKSFKDPEGVGLSANQIGRDERFFIAKTGKVFRVFFNPKIISKSKTNKVFFEGCLSIPNFYGETKRPSIIIVSYQDEKGKEIKKQLRGTLAWIFQHEMDHLNGSLFVDTVLQQKGRIFKSIGRDKTGSEVFEEVTI